MSRVASRIGHRGDATYLRKLVACVMKCDFQLASSRNKRVIFQYTKPTILRKTQYVTIYAMNVFF